MKFSKFYVQSLLLFFILYVPIIAVAQLGQSKQLLGQGMSADSTYLLKYETKVTNLGTEAICDVVIEDDISSNYTPCNVIGTAVVNVYGNGGLSVWSPWTQAWDGGVDWDLNGAQTSFDIGGNPDSTCVADCGVGFCLSPGQTVVIYFIVKLDDICFPAAGSTIVFDNSATSTGQSSGGTNYADTSTDGSDPSSPGSVPTPASVGYQEATIGSSQTITDTLGNIINEPTLNADGTYDFSYHITICNYDMIPNGGGSTLSDLTYWHDLDQLRDRGIPVNQVTVRNPFGPLIPNPIYDGIWGSEADVMDGGDLLAGQCDTVEIRINAGPAPSDVYDSYEWWNGTAVGYDGSEIIRDDSHDGDLAFPYNPDPNPTECLGATDNCEASRIKFNANPLIDLQKSFVKADPPMSGTLGNIDLTYKLTVTNLGDVNLTNLSVLDSLENEWSAACVVRVVGDSTMVMNIDATTPPLPNTNFTGVSSGAGGTADLLTGSSADLLGLNESFDIFFRVEVEASSCTDPLVNAAMAYGDAPNGDVVNDPATASADLPELGKIGDHIENDDTTLPIAGVMVILYNENGIPIDTAYTDSSGDYLFDGVFAGDYQVFVDSSNFDVGGPLEGLQNTTDPDDTFDNTSTLTLTEGEENLLQDFGYSPIVLPIELVSFKGYAEGCKNTLNWKTASEQNNAYFEVQRSIDGELFYPIKQIESTGNSSTFKEYMFSDRTPNNRTVYYRLQQVDLDGSISYSNVILIQNICYEDRDWNITAFPNPTKDNLTILATVNAAYSVRYKVYNIQGQLVSTDVANLEIGTTQLQIDTKDLAEGKYYVQLISETQFITSVSFIKLK